MTDAARDSVQRVNAPINQALNSAHSPVPFPNSPLNIQARDWCTSSAKRDPPRSKHTQPRHVADAALHVPSDWPQNVVYITQNLVAPSVPESIAQRYVLQPCTSALSHDSVVARSSPAEHLPTATHNDGRPQMLYSTAIQQQVPLTIWPIHRRTPWDPESFHSTSRNLECHPAAGSFGLFAADDIASNTFIRPYLGVLHTKADADFHSTYDLSLCHDPRLALLPSPTPAASHDSHDSHELTNTLQAVSLDNHSQNETHPTALYLDSRYWGNESRFVNDYRGIASKPNVEFRSFIQPSNIPHDHQPNRFQMGLFSTRPIRKGHELVINYGKSFWIHHQQLSQLENSSHPQPAQTANPIANSQLGNEQKLDPIQAMLQRSRMRVSRTAVHPQRRPHQPSPRT